jgi:hypothetical protein
VPRLNYPECLIPVRAFYLDIAQWAADDPARWGLLRGAEDADEGGIRDADVVTRKGPAAGVAAGPWW